jgi:carbon storage regulator
MTCHDCGYEWTICLDQFGNGRCPQCARKWLDHVLAIVDCTDVLCWCRRSGEGNSDVGRHDAAAGHGSPNQDGDGCCMEGRGMLVLSRKAGEGIVIGDGIEIVVNWIRGDKVSLGISAPKEINMRRSELAPKEDMDDNDQR